MHGRPSGTRSIGMRISLGMSIGLGVSIGIDMSIDIGIGIGMSIGIDMSIGMIMRTCEVQATHLRVEEGGQREARGGAQAAPVAEERDAVAQLRKPAGVSTYV